MEARRAELTGRVSIPGPPCSHPMDTAKEHVGERRLSARERVGAVRARVRARSAATDAEPAFGDEITANDVDCRRRIRRRITGKTSVNLPNNEATADSAAEVAVLREDVDGSHVAVCDTAGNGVGILRRAERDDASVEPGFKRRRMQERVHHAEAAGVTREPTSRPEVGPVNAAPTEFQSRGQLIASLGASALRLGDHGHVGPRARDPVTRTDAARDCLVADESWRSPDGGTEGRRVRPRLQDDHRGHVCAVADHADAASQSVVFSYHARQ